MFDINALIAALNKIRDAIIGNKEIKGNSAADGSGDTHNVVVDSSGRMHTRSFKNAAGEGRRMLVDDDRHGQVDVLSVPNGMTGMEIPAYNYIATTWVASGNGVGKIATRVFKTGGAAGTTVATITFGYNASHQMISETKT